MKKKILLIEENKALSFLIETVLEKNYETIPVTGSNFAMLHLLSGERFDVLVISIESVGSDNFQFLHHVSTSSVLNKVPVVVLSNAGSPDLKAKCEASGIAAFLHKPFDPQLFVQRMDELTFVKQTNHVTRKKINVFNLNINF